MGTPDVQGSYGVFSYYTSDPFEDYPDLEGGEVLYGGKNPYIDAIRHNMTHLIRIIESGDWSLLRRKPACFLGIAQAVHDIERLVAGQLESLKRGRIRPENTLLMPV